MASTDPKIATQGQWEDLAARVKSAATVPDGSVTVEKFAQYAVNEGIVTENNLSPTADTPAAWNTLLGGGERGVYKTRYNTLNIFTNQPSQYGELFTVRSSTDIIQFWLRYNQPLMYRYGNGSGWQSRTSGAFMDIIDRQQLYTRQNATEITANVNLNHLNYCQPRKYFCRLSSTVQTLTNCPAISAFAMEVINVVGTSADISSDDDSTYLVRTITEINGNMWIQKVNSSSSTPVTWYYGDWRPIDNNITVTSTDPGEGSALAAGQFIAVY